MEDKNVSCGCINTGFDGKPRVAQATIGIPVPPEVNAKKIHDVEDFRSQNCAPVVASKATNSLAAVDTNTRFWSTERTGAMGMATSRL